MIVQSLYKRKGVSAPEFIGAEPECVNFMLEGLRERGVIYKESIETVNDESWKYGEKLKDVR
jgi:hypothetical protein